VFNLLWQANLFDKQNTRLLIHHAVSASTQRRATTAVC
jgi:hypothetical protein